MEMIELVPATNSCEFRRPLLILGLAITGRVIALTRADNVA